MLFSLAEYGESLINRQPAKEADQDPGLSSSAAAWLCPGGLGGGAGPAPLLFAASPPPEDVPGPTVDGLVVDSAFAQGPPATRHGIQPLVPPLQSVV